MDTEYRTVSAILLIVATALISSAPAIATLIPTTGPWAWLSVLFGIVIIALREWVKQKGQEATAQTEQTQ